MLITALLLGCRPECGVEVTYSDSPHTVELVWSDPDWSGDLTYGFAEDFSRSVPVVSDGGENAATLTGLPALSEIYYLLSVDGQECSGTLTTNNLDPATPSLTVSLYEPDQAGAWRSLAGVVMGESPSLFVLDRFGNWLWSYAHDPELISSAVSVQDGEILYNTFSRDRSIDVGAIHRLALDGTVVDEVTTEGAHHVFTQLPDGALAWPSIDVREWLDPDAGESVSVVGDRILEVSAEGTIREVFNIWDHEEPVKHDGWDSGFYEQGHDWTHTNTVNYSAERDSYLISFAHMDVIYEIDRASGEPILRIDPGWVESGTVYEFQHDPNWTDAGTLLMMSYPQGRATAIEYAVDAESQTLSELWSYEDEQQGVPLLGQARRLENGNTLINYGGHGAIREVTESGSLVWIVESGLGNWFGNVVLLEDGLF